MYATQGSHSTKDTNFINKFTGFEVVYIRKVFETLCNMICNWYNNITHNSLLSLTFLSFLLSLLLFFTSTSLHFSSFFACAFSPLFLPLKGHIIASSNMHGVQLFELSVHRFGWLPELHFLFFLYFAIFIHVPPLPFIV